MVSLYSNLFTPSEDLWFFDNSGSDLAYYLLLKPTQVTGLNTVLRIVDYHDQVHLFFADKSRRAFHVIWNNTEWKKFSLPFCRWDDLLTFVDSDNCLYILSKESSRFNLWIWEHSKYTACNLFMDGLDGRPLYFRTDDLYIYLYLTDPAWSNVSVTTISLETGKIQAYDTLIKDNDYCIFKHWSFNDSLIFVREKKTARHTQVMKVSFDSQKKMIYDLGPFGSDKNTSYHLLADKKTLLLLASSHGCVYYCFSPDEGKQWTNSQESTLLSPVIFSDIQSVNSSPTSLICLKQMKGTTLYYPLVLTLSELHNMIRKDKVIYQDSVFKSRKTQGFFSRFTKG